MSDDSLLDEINKLVDERFQHKSVEFDSENPSVPLVNTPYGSDEIMEVLESLMSTYVTMGDKVEQFEKDWSDYIGLKHGVMANSGSSANLLALKALSEDFGSDSEVIVPAVGWSTTVFPVIDAGATPVFVDVDPEIFAIDVESLEAAVNENTEAVILVHLLGNPAPMDRIMQICDENDLALIEDCAEAHGAEFDGQKVGSFGEFGTFSFSFSHHITTTEGGMAVTDSTEYQDRMKMLRSWGKVRDIEDSSQFVDDESEMDTDFLFVSHGYNLRPTEIQGAFGIHQTRKIDEFVRKRRERARYLNEELGSIKEIKVLEERKGVKCSYLHYPILLNENSDYSRDELRSHLEDHGIETRPLLSGNMAKHPAFQSDKFKTHGELTGASYIHENGLYVSNHHYLTEDHMDYIIEIIKSFFRG